MSTPEAYIAAHRDRMLAELLEFLRIPSISTDPAHKQDIEAAAQWVAGRLRVAGMPTVEIVPTGGHPVVYAASTEAPERPTLLIYGHYDVQPVDPLDQWRSDPFVPDIRDDRIYARGVSDDKGPMFIPIKAAEALFAAEGRLPVNVKMMFEGEEEIGSPNLNDFVVEQADLLAADFALSADGAMWRIDEPSITVGSRGLTALDVQLRGPQADLHSGRHGGSVQNPLHALVELLATLHESDGRVAVAGFYDDVRELDPDERRQIARLDFDDEAYRAAVGVPALFGEAGYSTLERQWIRPTLELNGLAGGYDGPGTKTVIPAVARAKITCRLVPDQRPDDIRAKVTRHLELHAPPGVELTVVPHAGGAPPYRIRPDHLGLRIARAALQRQYGQEPVDVFAGGTLPVSEIFHRVLGIDTVFFSFSTADEGFHGPNEFFRLPRLWDGMAAWIIYWQLAGSHEL